MRDLRLRGLRAGNLQKLDLDLPLGRWTAIHGPSGAGKSALLFGTLEPVASRRFALLSHPDSLPGGAEDWLEPIADNIQGLPPTLASAGEIPRKRRHIEVGVVLDLWPFLAKAWAHCSERCCPHCQHQWQQPQLEALLNASIEWPLNERVHFFSDASTASTESLLLSGWTRARLGDNLVRLEEAPAILPQGTQLLLDRFKWKGDSSLARLRETLSEALRRGAPFSIEVSSFQPVLIPGSAACPQCEGEVPRRDSAGLVLLSLDDAAACRDVLIEGRAWADWCKAPLSDWHDSLSNSTPSTASRRLNFLVRTGLGHLSPNRTLGTLSLGEGRRLELVSWLAQARTGQLLLFDEPGMGLHGSERRDLAELLQELTRQGNTVLTADPAREFLEAADEWLHLGPGGGPEGGRIVAQGIRRDLPKAELAVPFLETKLFDLGTIDFVDLVQRHLSVPALNVPMGSLVAFCGVSGSGKTTLLEHEILPRLRSGEGFEGKLPMGGVRVLLERALGHSPWSTVATLSGAWSEIREQFAQGEEGRIRGLAASDFVARPNQGACQTCAGHGAASDGVPCGHCSGLGLRQDLLDLRLRSRSLRQWLTTPLSGLEKRLPQNGRLRTLVKHLCELGLGSRTFGERGRHLSLGERGRLALARALASARLGRPQLFLLDEPCLGLPIPDAMRVVKLLRSLCREGHSFWVVEHHEVLLRSADWLIELGPGAGPAGGQLLFEGAPSGLENASTPTAEWLRLSRQEVLQPPEISSLSEPVSECIAENLALPARARLEEDLLREMATRSPLLVDALPAQVASTTLLPPVAWPVVPTARTPLISVLGMDAPLKAAMRQHGRATCPACQGEGPWPDFLTAVQAMSSAHALERATAGDRSEFIYATPLESSIASGDAVGLLHAAGFRRFLRGGQRVKISNKVPVMSGDPIWLDRIDLHLDVDAPGRLRDLEHHAELLGQGDLWIYAPGQLDKPIWKFHADACRDCEIRSRGVVAQIGGLTQEGLLALPLQESLTHLQKFSDSFQASLDLLSATGVLRATAVTTIGQLTELAARCAHLVGWLLSPLDGVVMLAAQPLAGLPSKVSQRFADAFEDGRHGVWRWSDAEGLDKHSAQTPLAFELTDWSYPTRVSDKGTLRDALCLNDALIQHFLRTEDARVQGLSRTDLQAKGRLACSQCKGRATFSPHPELMLPCARCSGLGWRRAAMPLEDRGLAWPYLGQMKISHLAQHFEATPALGQVFETALALGMGGLRLDEVMRRLPAAIRQWSPLCGLVARGGSWRISGPFTGLTPLEAERIASTMDGFSHSGNDFEQQGHPALGEPSHD